MQEDDTREADRTSAEPAKRSLGTKVSVDELVAKGRTVLDRVVPMFERAASNIRSRFARK